MRYELSRTNCQKESRTRCPKEKLQVVTQQPRSPRRIFRIPPNHYKIAEAVRGVLPKEDDQKRQVQKQTQGTCKNEEEGKEEISGSAHSYLPSIGQTRDDAMLAEVSFSRI